MTAPHEEMVVDAEGIPILTEIIDEHDAPAPVDEQEAGPPDNLSPAEIADALMHNESFRLQLDSLAVNLTQNLRQQIELALFPAIEEAITRALDDSGAGSSNEVREQLEAALPELLARALTDQDD